MNTEKQPLDFRAIVLQCADRRAWDNTGKAQDLINDALDRAGREEEG